MRSARYSAAELRQVRTLHSVRKHESGARFPVSNLVNGRINRQAQRGAACGDNGLHQVFCYRTIRVEIELKPQGKIGRRAHLFESHRRKNRCDRSEERRVGKEWRTRWATPAENK